MALEPKPGLIVFYDFLWKEERNAGRDSGVKDRPCAIVLTLNERPDGSKDVLLCAITHSPPGKGETAVPIPAKVARHLGFDDEQSWVKTDQVNRLHWQKGRVPCGIRPIRKGQWTYGMIPQKLGQRILKQLREKARAQSLSSTRRD